MKTLVSVCLAAFFCLMANQANAQFTFPTDATVYSPVNNTAQQTINFNNAANIAGVTSGMYGSFDVTVDWADFMGDGAFSSEARVATTIAAGTTGRVGPTNGVASTASVPGLAFSGGLAGVYDPDVDGSFDLTISQIFNTFSGVWSNISVTLNTFVPPPLPTVLDTMSATGTGAGGSFDTRTAAGPGVLWYALVYDGVGPLTIDTEGSVRTDTELGLYDSNGFLVETDDDDGTGFLSSITRSDLSAGTYYIAAASWSATFDGAFGAATTSTNTDDINVNVSTIPEPGSIAILGLAGCAFLMRRRK